MKIVNGFKSENFIPWTKPHQSGSPMKKSIVIFLHNCKDIIVISNCAKFHPKIRWNKGSNLRVKFVFYTAAIKMTELGRMSRGEVMMS